MILDYRTYRKQEVLHLGETTFAFAEPVFRLIFFNEDEKLFLIETFGLVVNYREKLILPVQVYEKPKEDKINEKHAELMATAGGCA